jgi:ribose transport system ATP-binding protein
MTAQAPSAGEAGLTRPPRLELEGVSKTYGRFRALQDVRLTIMPGELHGLVGQNGSGKSTLAGILTGYRAPDPGSVIRIDGQQLRLPIRLRQAQDLGLAVVHQTLGLIDEATVLENIRVGRLGARRWSRRITWEAERDSARQVLEQLGCPVRLDEPVGQLPAEDRATVAIARAIQQAQDGKGIVIFDESTRALSRDSLHHFYELVQQVLATGTAVLLISHRLDEVLNVTDTVTILRDGQVVESGSRTADLDHGQLVAKMLGRQLLADVAGGPAGAGEPGEAGGEVSEADKAPAAAARISGLTGSVLRGFDLQIGRGEVVGVTGLVGSGHEELPYLLADDRRAASGTLEMGGRRLDLTAAGCADALAAGVALVPENRDVDGLAAQMTIAENITLPHLRAHGTRMRLDRKWENREVQSLLDQLGVRPPAPAMAVGSLSGGNRQKVLLAKWLARQPDLLVLHDPTQAVDVGARHDLIAAIRKAAGQGCGVLVASGDEEELAALCDRVLIIKNGTVGTELSAPLSPGAIAESVYSRAVRPLRPVQG